MIQKISFILIFLASYMLFLKGLHGTFKSIPYVGIALLGFLTNWLISVFFLWACKIVPFRLSNRYYEFQKFELDRRIYERIGVTALQPIIKFLGLIKFSGVKSDLNELVQHMRHAELNHILTLSIVFLLAIMAAINSAWWYAVWLTVFNVLFNAYPIMLQRYNRVRLEPIAKRYERKY